MKSKLLLGTIGLGLFLSLVSPKAQANKLADTNKQNSKKVEQKCDIPLYEKKEMNAYNQVIIPRINAVVTDECGDTVKTYNDLKVKERLETIVVPYNGSVLIKSPIETNGKLVGLIRYKIINKEGHIDRIGTLENGFVVLDTKKFFLDSGRIYKLNIEGLCEGRTVASVEGSILMLPEEMSQKEFSESYVSSDSLLEEIAKQLQEINRSLNVEVQTYRKYTLLLNSYTENKLTRAPTGLEGKFILPVKASEFDLYMKYAEGSKEGRIAAAQFNFPFKNYMRLYLGGKMSGIAQDVDPSKDFSKNESASGGVSVRLQREGEEGLFFGGSLEKTWSGSDIKAASTADRKLITGAYVGIIVRKNLSFAVNYKINDRDQMGIVISSMRNEDLAKILYYNNTDHPFDLNLLSQNDNYFLLKADASSQEEKNLEVKDGPGKIKDKRYNGLIGMKKGPFSAYAQYECSSNQSFNLPNKIWSEILQQYIELEPTHVFRKGDSVLKAGILIGNIYGFGVNGSYDFNNKDNKSIGVIFKTKF